MIKKYIIFFVSFLLICYHFAFLPVFSEINSSDCKDIKVIFVDGSGAVIDGTDNNYLDFQDAVDNVLRKTGLSYDFYELGSEEQYGHQYPAVAVGFESLTDVMTSIGAYVSAGKSYTYGESFEEGKDEMTAYFIKTLSSCPNTKFILGGLSQGAGVVSMSLPYLTSEPLSYADKIIYAATFGDAKLYLPEGQGLNPAACRGENLSDYREYVPDCDVYQGLLKGQIPYEPESMSGKVGTWCNHYDMICTSRINWFNLAESTVPHGSYGNSFNADRLYYDAAEVIYQKVLEEFNLTEEKIEANKPKHNLALLIDTTGSMTGLIDSYKNEALRLATSIYEKGGKVALYEYKDITADNFQPKQHCSFETCSLETIQNILDNLETDGGGDDPESMLAASMQAMNELFWEDGAVKSIVALTDASYRDMEVVDGKTIDLNAVKLRSLEIDPVNIYTITPDSIKSEYTELTSATGGKSFSSTGELSFSTDYIFNRPDVKLARESYVGMINEEFYFDASATTADTEIEKYEWDLDFDGVFETETSVPYVKAKYNDGISGFVQVKATDKNGLSGTMSARVEVLENTTTKESISLKITSTNLNKDKNEITLHFATDAYRVLVYVNDVLIGVTDGDEITIGDLDLSIENNISLVPYGDGISYPGESDEFLLEISKEDAINDNEPMTEEEISDPIIYDNKKQKGDLKSPNCGVAKITP